jgi:REP element-mobilizing transposase RayT
MHHATSARKSVIFSLTKSDCKWPAPLVLYHLVLIPERRDVKFITVWFQNRRQSDKRKAWTKKDRARKKENTCHKIHIHTVFSKPPAVSLDQIASRLERVQSPSLSERSRAVLSTQKLENSIEPATPTRSKPEALWAHMPSSPPDAPSSPPSDGLRSMTTPCLVKSGKSLEWACAKERMGNKYRLKRDKGTRLVELQGASPRKPQAVLQKEPGSDSDSDQDIEALTPAQSQATSDNGTPSGAKAASESRPDELRGKSTKDVEAAMALLQFLRG